MAQSLRSYMKSIRWLHRLYRFFRLVNCLGFSETGRYLIRASNKTPFFSIKPKTALYPLFCRQNTSDFKVFAQIFVQRGYSCLDHIDNAAFIIDCGGNAGYSSAYFLTRFPESTVVAIEPDPGNFSMMCKNLAPYGNRIQTLNSAVWSHCADLAMEENKYRDGEEWSRQVRECKAGEKALLKGIDIGTLLAKSGQKRISILKIDIEGAEAVVFASPNSDLWLQYVDALVIELHDDTQWGNCSNIFFSAISKQNFDISRCCELTLCTRAGRDSGPLQSTCR